MALMSTVLPFWMGQRYGIVRLVSPMHLLAYFASFGFLTKAVVYPSTPEWAFYARFVDTPGAGLTGALYLTVFIMMLCLGYRLAVRPVDIRSGQAAARQIAAGLQRRGALFAAAFAIAALTVILILRARGMSGVSHDMLETLNTDKQIDVSANGVGSTLAGIKSLFIVPKCAFVLLLAHGIVTRDGFVFGLAGMIAGLLVLTALISGDRFELVELLAYGAATYLIVGGRLRMRSLLAAAGAVVLVLLLSAYMTTLRGSDAGLLHQIVASTYFLDFNASVMVTDRVSPAMYLLGDSYTWWSFGWVPRAIWLDKPAIDLGVSFKRDVMGIDTGGAFNVTGPGEAFINFGWAGAFVGAVLGWIYRRGEAYLLSAQASLGHASFVFYPLLFYPFVQATLQSSFSAYVVGAVAQGILICAMIALFIPRYRPLTHLQRSAYAS